MWWTGTFTSSLPALTSSAPRTSAAIGRVSTDASASAASEARSERTTPVASMLRRYAVKGAMASLRSIFAMTAQRNESRSTGPYAMKTGTPR